jgi:hypothetical protein
MKNYLFIPVCLLVLLIACKEKDSKSDEGAISAISIIKGQLHELDTSLYQFSRIEIKDNDSDTFFLKRGEVRGLAEPFLSVPDITTDNYSKKYTEDRLIDAEQQTLNITSTAKNENAEVQRQIIIAALADLSSGKVKNIYIERYLPSSDSTLEQKLFWEIDKSFQITNIIQKENKPEEIRRIKVDWQ